MSNLYVRNKPRLSYIIFSDKRSIALALLGTSPFWLSILFLIYGPSYTFNSSKIIKIKLSNIMAIKWSTENLTKLSIPTEIQDKVDKIEVAEKTIKIQVWFHNPHQWWANSWIFLCMTCFGKFANLPTSVPYSDLMIRVVDRKTANRYNILLLVYVHTLLEHEGHLKPFFH